MCNAASTAMPATSLANGSHCAEVCSAPLTACNQSANGRAACSGVRSAATRSAIGAMSGCSAGTARQVRLPIFRKAVSASVTCAASKAGAFFSQSSTLSVDASHGSAPSKPIRVAAARVVDSFQPVSSRSATPFSASMARTRRVSKRSCAISATGQRPARKWASVQAAARCASSSRSCAVCKASAPCCSGVLSWMLTARAAKWFLSASVSGSV